ncbi:MAG: peptide chain release factor N(5)-glutamine methyltransferase [Pseudomonadales bacterium]|nr:peptide chain release factor N(5)-glutamine methyltransferase [Pseudomonadales bacterium]
MALHTESGNATVRDALAHARRLESVSDSALLDTELLLAHALGVNRSWLIAHAHDRIGEQVLAEFETMIARRSTGEPLAYVIGKRGFWDVELDVEPGVLVPRPETECLVEALLSRLDNSPRCVIDVATGSGAIAIALARERSEWKLVATDLSADALRMAARNVRIWAPDRVAIARMSWLAAIPASSIDVLACNPPYIRENDPHLAALSHEPVMALASGTDGLDAINAMAVDASRCLVPGGTLALEHGYDQRDAVIAILARAGLADIDTLDDLSGTPRIAIARKK